MNMEHFISIRYVQRKLIDRICKSEAHEENLKIFNEIAGEWRDEQRETSAKGNRRSE